VSGAWGETSGKLWGFEMLTFLFGAYYHKLRGLRAHIDIIETYKKRPEPLTGKFYADTITSLNELKKSCGELFLIQSGKRIDRIIAHISRQQDDAYLLIHLSDLEAAMREEGEDHLAINIPPDRGRLLYREPQYWDGVSDKFPSASVDCASALICYACDQNTASVFHSMRVVEWGLKALSEALGLPFGTDVWHVAIDRIEAEMRELEKTWPKGRSKTDLLKFYSEAAKEFRYFKDGWRNFVSHNNNHYDDSQALSTLSHVKDFMFVISSRLSEV
jgi:hypothetical protein